MTETTESQNKSTRDAKESFLGAATLLLIFLASISFTWARLSDMSQAQQNVPTVQAASVALSETGPVTPDPFANVKIEAKSAIVVDETTGRTLYALNPDAQWPYASLTKVPLTLVVSEVLPPDAIITIPYNTAPPGSYQRLAKGEKWTVQDVIDFTLAISSNEGADILADAGNDALHQKYPDSPAEGAALWRMNDLAHQLGLSHTYFLNDNGLDVSPSQSGAYGSARDVATIFSYAASTSPKTFAATTKPSFTLVSPTGAKTPAINTDQALSAVPGIILGKTGFTDLAGGNLAIVFNAKGHRIVAVVLGSTESGRFTDMKTLVSLCEQAIPLEK